MVIVGKIWNEKNKKKNAKANGNGNPRVEKMKKIIDVRKPFWKVPIYEINEREEEKIELT